MRGKPLWMDSVFCPYKTKTLSSLLHLLSPCDNMVKRQPSATLKIFLTLPEPNPVGNLISHFQLLELQLASAAHKPLRLWCFDTAAHTDEVRNWHSEVRVCCCKEYLNVWKELWNRVTGGIWKSMEVHARKSLYCHKQTIKGSGVESSQRRGDLQGKLQSSER